MARPRLFVLAAATVLSAVAAVQENPSVQINDEQLESDNAGLRVELATAREEAADLRRQLSEARASSTMLLPGAPAPPAPPPAPPVPPPAPPAPPPAADETRLTHRHYDTALGEIGFRVAAFLRESSYQNIIAMVVVVVGLLSILDAVLFTRCISVGAAAVAVGMLANNEASEAWRGVLGDTEMWAVGLEAGAITAAAAYVGFAGFQLIAGACLALGSAHLAARWAMIYAWQPHAIFVFFALSAALGVSAMRVGDRAACALLGPVTGGLMVASGLVFFCFDFMNVTASASPPWIDFADALLSGGGASNVFGGTGGYLVARSIGGGIWFLVAGLGFSRYFLGCPRLGFFDGDGDDGLADLTMPLHNDYKPARVEPIATRVVAPPKYNDYMPRSGSGGGPPGPPPPFRGGRR